MKTLEERLDTLERIIKKPSFRESRGLGNEVGYYIFDYPAEEELRVRERIKYLKNRNKDGTEDFVIQRYFRAKDIWKNAMPWKRKKVFIKSAQQLRIS